MTKRLFALAALLAVAAGTGAVSLSRVGDQLAVLEACEAAQRGEWPQVLDATRDRTGTDDTGRAAAECRCTALLALDRGEACADLLGRVLGDDGWTPQPELAVHAIQTWRERGLPARAAELARRAGRRHPRDPVFFALELSTRSGVEDEEALLAELEARLPASGEEAARMRVQLAGRHLLRGDAGAALAVLGEGPPPEAGAALGRWFEMRGRAAAATGDLAAVRASYDAWRDAGGSPAELFARYALTLSLAGLADPRLEPVRLLADAFEASADVGDPALREALGIRLVLTLVVAGRQQEALAFYDRARGELTLEGLSREELERSDVQRRLAQAGDAGRRVEIRLRVPGAAEGVTLWLSPEPDLPPDTEYERLPVPPSGQVEAWRRPGTHPIRWVHRDAAGHVRASGTLSPAANGPVEVRVEPGAPASRRAVRLGRAPADGRSRVVLILPDCQDWHLVQYLRARGELPVLDALLRDGYRAVLESDPPLTAAALEALVWPERHASPSFVGLLQQLGLELAGLSSIGDNPFAALDWLRPPQPDLFSVVGAGERRAANLLLSHGGIRAGRHGEITGPAGRRQLAPIARSARDLGAAERQRWPGLADLPGRDAIHVRTIAAELDAAEALAADRSLDLVMLRIEPLDILTHAHFAETVIGAQDDGEGLLFEIYRYIDARLAAVHDRLDADDVFIVMSDHGIRTAMEHSRDALFVAVGDGVPPGRAPGRPELRGVPRVLAGVLGIRTAWPDTGVAGWAGREALASLAPPVPKADPRPPPASH